MKVYVSSTYQDLTDHRIAVDRTLRRMGHDVWGMEQYVAEGSRPLDRCRADVRAADIYIVILAWRYGYIPEGPINPDRKSITELEHDEAVASGKPVLAFLLDPEAPWPLSRVDALADRPGAGSDITRFRAQLGTAYLAGIFRTPDDLASQVAAAVAAQGLTRHMVERVLVHTSVTAEDMGNFGSGSALFDTTVISIKGMVSGSGATRALVIDLGKGDRWWSTRLYLLANLLRSLTNVRQLVFRNADGRFAGMASPTAVVEGMARDNPLLDEFSRELRLTESSVDTERETDRQVSAWNNFVASRFGGNEGQAKIGVRAQLLERWLGERLVTRCIRVDKQGLSMAQVQQIVESLLPDVPVERWVDDVAPSRALCYRLSIEILLLLSSLANGSGPACREIR